MSKHLKLIVGVVISVAAAWYAIKDIEFGKVVALFGNLNWGWLAISFVPYFALIFIKVTRWQLLFYPAPKVGLHRLFATLMMSYLFNTVLPARMGEVVRAYALSRSEKIGTVRVLSTILLEKILDIMMMIFFLVVLLPFVNLSDEIKRPALAVGAVVIVAFVTCLLMAAFRSKAEALIRWVFKVLPAKLADKLFGFATEILDVLQVLLKAKLSANLWFQTAVIWLMVALNYMLIGFALNVPLTFPITLVMLIALNLGMAIPSAPGYIGVYEGLVVFSLTPFFPGQESMLFGLGLFLHVVSFLPVIIMGMFYTSREGLSLGKVTGDKLKTTDEAKTPLEVSTPV